MKLAEWIALCDREWAGGTSFAGDVIALTLTAPSAVELVNDVLTEPGAAVCLSPWTDLTQDTPSMDANVGTDPMLDRPRLENYAGWYLGQNTDVAEAGLEPLAHFVARGAAEGRAPSPWFDMAHHIAARGADLDPSANPLIDYLQGGAWAVSEARPGFPTAAYLAQHPQLLTEGMTPLEHWARVSTGRG